jgi:hypothetical protein
MGLCLKQFQEKREAVKFGDFAVTLRPELRRNKEMDWPFSDRPWPCPETRIKHVAQNCAAVLGKRHAQKQSLRVA